MPWDDDVSAGAAASILPPWGSQVLVGDTVLPEDEEFFRRGEALLLVTLVNVIINVWPETKTATLPFSGVNITFINF